MIAKAFLGLAFLLGVLGAALFVPAGTLAYWQAWMFLAIISVFNLIFDSVAILFGGYGTSFSDYSLSFLVNGLILIYVMLPGTKAAFGIPNAPPSNAPKA